MHEIVPHSLSDEQKEPRALTCENVIMTCQTNSHFFSCIVTGDWSLMFQWKISKHGVENKIITETQKDLHVKVEDQNCGDHILIVSGIDHKENMHEGETQNWIHVQVLEMLLSRCWDWDCNLKKKGVSYFCTAVPLHILQWWWGTSRSIMASWLTSHPAPLYYIPYNEAHPHRKMISGCELYGIALDALDDCSA